MPRHLILAFLALSLITEPIAAQSEPKGGLEEIVVRARKRDELLVDTPISVTALSETALRDAGVTRLDEIQDFVPNLQFTVGRENQEGFIRLRGVGTASGEIVFDPGVAVYVDGVFLPRMIGQLVDVVDVQQVEVLRGPQGTLFGKNSVGGAISVTTVKPQPDLGAHFLVSAGEFDTVRTRTSFNLPLIEDRLYSRFAFATNQTSGYTENKLRSIDASDQDSLAFLGSLRLELTDDIMVDVSGSWSRDHGHGRGGQCRIVDDMGIGVLIVPGFREACDNSRRYSFNGNVAGLADTSSWGSWGTVTWDALDGPVSLTLKNIVSWREQKPGHRSDSDFTEFSVLSLDFSGDENNPSWSQRQISEELQSTLYFWDDRASLVTGAFGFWERGRAPTGIDSLNGGVQTQNITRINNWTWAIYSHAVVEPLEWLSLTAGIRYTQDKKGAQLEVRNRLTGDPPESSSNSEVFDDVTPTVSLGLKATDDIADLLYLDHGNLYFTWAQGFRGGGFNALIGPQSFGNKLLRFKPETLDSFEIGLKTIAFDNRLSVNLSGFYGKYDDIQVFSVRAEGDFEDPFGTVSVQPIVQNAAEATVQGLELEVLANPTDELTIRGSLGLLDTEYDDFGKNCRADEYDPADPDPSLFEDCATSDITASPERGAYFDRSGEGFNVSPDLTTQLTFAYAFAIDDAPWDFLIGTITPRFEWSYQGRMHVLGPEAGPGIQEEFHLFNVRLAYDLWDDRTQIAFWGKNLSDERHFDRAESLAVLGFMSRYFQQPRTFGGEISFTF